MIKEIKLTCLKLVHVLLHAENQMFVAEKLVL